MSASWHIVANDRMTAEVELAGGIDGAADAAG
jgi:hypothetical protein